MSASRALGFLCVRVFCLDNATTRGPRTRVADPFVTFGAAGHMSGRFPRRSAGDDGEALVRPEDVRAQLHTFIADEEEVRTGDDSY